MTYSHSKKLTTAEKRLQTLKSQLYGKEKPANISQPKATVTFTAPKSINSTPSSSKPLLEVNYLQRDLVKTTILASLIIVGQLILYFSLQKL